MKIARGTRARVHVAAARRIFGRARIDARKYKPRARVGLGRPSQPATDRPTERPTRGDESSTPRARPADDATPPSPSLTCGFYIYATAAAVMVTGVRRNGENGEGGENF